MSFDLNISNYTKKELIEMFDLPTNYDIGILEIKDTKMRESIMNNTEINKDTQMKTIQFLIKAKTILINELPDNSNNAADNKSSGLSSLNTLYVNLQFPDLHFFCCFWYYWYVAVRDCTIYCR